MIDKKCGKVHEDKEHNVHGYSDEKDDESIVCKYSKKVVIEESGEIENNATETTKNDVDVVAILFKRLRNFLFTYSGMIPAASIVILSLFTFIVLCSPVMRHAGYNVFGNGFENAFSVDVSVALTVSCFLLLCLFATGVFYSLSRVLSVRANKGFERGNIKTYVIDVILITLTFIVDILLISLPDKYLGQADASSIILLVVCILDAIILAGRILIDRVLYKEFCSAKGKNKQDNEENGNHDVIKNTAIKFKGSKSSVYFSALLVFIFSSVLVFNTLTTDLLNDYAVVGSFSSRSVVEQQFGLPENCDGDEEYYDYYIGEKYVFQKIIDVLIEKENEIIEQEMESSLESGYKYDRLTDKINEIEELVEKLRERAKNSEYKHIRVVFENTDSDKENNESHAMDEVISYYCTVYNAGIAEEETTRTLKKLEVVKTYYMNDNVVKIIYKASYHDGSFIYDTEYVDANDLVK